MAGCSPELAVTGAVSSWMFLACADASSVQAVFDAVDGCISGNWSVCLSICHAWQRRPPFPVNLRDLVSL